MTLKVISEKENPLFKRKEVKVSISSEKSPSREEISKLLSEKFSIPAENVKIKGIWGSLGSKIFDIEANLYSSKKDKDLVEFKKKKEIESSKKLVEVAS